MPVVKVNGEFEFFFFFPLEKGKRRKLQEAKSTLESVVLVTKNVI